MMKPISEERAAETRALDLGGRFGSSTTSRLILPQAIEGAPVEFAQASLCSCLVLSGRYAAAPESIATPQGIAAPERIATPQCVPTPERVATPQSVAAPQCIVARKRGLGSSRGHRRAPHHEL